MSRLKSNQKGFSAIEGLLVLIVILMIGFIGYYVYHAQSKANDTYNSSTEVSNSPTVKAKKSTAATGQKLSLASGTVTATIPSTWSQAKVDEGCLRSDNSICSDNLEAVAVSPTDAAKVRSDDVFGAGIQIYKVTDGKNPHDWFFDDYMQGLQGVQYTVLPMTINGSPAVSIKDAPKDNAYVDQYYVVIKGDKAVVLTARVSSKGYASNGVVATVDTNNTKYLPDLKNIANSISIQ